jgi:hypothetical protein
LKKQNLLLDDVEKDVIETLFIYFLGW